MVHCRSDSTPEDSPATTPDDCRNNPQPEIKAAPVGAWRARHRALGWGRPPGTGAPLRHRSASRPGHSASSRAAVRAVFLARLLSNSRPPRLGRPSGAASRWLPQPGPGARSRGCCACEEDGGGAGLRLLDVLGASLPTARGSGARSSRINSRTACLRAGLRDQTPGRSTIITLIRTSTKNPIAMIRASLEKKHETPPVVSKENGTARHSQNVFDWPFG